MSDIFETELEQEERETAIANREAFEQNLSNIWGHSSLGLEAKKAAMSMLSTKNGMYARIPLVCKAHGCPYADSCPLLKYNLAPLGEPCPKETAELELRYSAYDQDFQLDDASFTDRLRALLVKEEVLIVDVGTGITEQGEEYTHTEVSKTWEAYERVEKKRNNIYDLMLATRKSQKSKDNDGGDKSITQILSEVMTAQDFVIDVKPDNLD